MPGTPRPARLLVGRRSLGPQVELSPVSLNLPPNGDRTQTEQGDYKQLLHDRKPFQLRRPGSLANARASRET
jgi:hypothetical protein